MFLTIEAICEDCGKPFRVVSHSLDCGNAFLLSIIQQYREQTGWRCDKCVDDLCCVPSRGGAQIFAVNVYNYCEPELPVPIHNVSLAGAASGYKGGSSDPFCFRQVAIVADTPEEALEKAKSVEV